jgi:hypothetical protein
MHIINEAIIDRLVTSLAEIIARQIITDYAISRRHEMKMKLDEGGRQEVTRGGQNEPAENDLNINLVRHDGLLA